MADTPSHHGGSENITTGTPSGTPSGTEDMLLSSPSRPGSSGHGTDDTSPELAHDINNSPDHRQPDPTTENEQDGDAGAVDDEDDNEDARSHSTTSTEEHEHEPLETYQNKVIQLFREKFPTLKRDAFRIERIPGGCFNRIVGVIVDHSKTRISVLGCLRSTFKCAGSRKTKSQSEEKYIVRIPRFQDIPSPKLRYELATHTFAYRQFNSPVPRLIDYDLTTNNPLGGWYSIQQWIPGKGLGDEWDALTLDQKKMAAWLVANFIRQTHAQTAKVAGIVDDSYLDHQDALDVSVVAFPPHHKFYDSSHKVLPPYSALDFLVNKCDQWIEKQREGYLNEENPFYQECEEYFQTLKKVAQEMHQHGYLKDDTFHFSHNDLHLDNIFVQVQPDGNIELSGVIDWDLAAFVPKFVACEPPLALWSDGYDDAEFDKPELSPYQSYNGPEDPHAPDIKATFDSAAGPEYCHYAYLPEYRLLRDLNRILDSGISSSYQIDRLERIRDFWNKKKEELLAENAA